mgnify:CR=1 FL=1
MIHTLSCLFLIAFNALAFQPSISHSKIYNILDFGAVGNGKTMNTIAIQKAIDAAHKSRGGTVVVPEGEFVTGTIYFKDDVILHLNKNAVLIGSPFLKDYPINELTTFRSYTERYTKKALIYAEGVDNIGITGQGTIYGNSYAREFMEAERGKDKPAGIRLVSCKNVTIRGVTISSAGLWLQHYLNCTNLDIQGITAINHGHFTNDGLNIDGCRNVTIKDVYIDSHDDALVFKSTGPAKCENVFVRNCVLKSHCHGLKFGTETTAGFKNVDIANIDISPSDSLHFKTGKLWRVITGVAMEITDGGQMENVTIKNLRADSVYAPIFIKLGNRARKYKEDIPVPEPGSINGVTLSNFHITDAGKFSSSVTGFPGHTVKNIILENIFIEYNEVPDSPELFDEVPENEERYPEITMFTKGMDKRHYLPSHGLFIRHVDGLILKNFVVKTLDNDPRPKFQMIHTKNVIK